MCQKFFHCIFILANFMLRKTNYNFQPQLLTESVRRLWHFIVFASFGVDVVYLMLTMTGDMREGLVLRSLLCTSVVVFALSSVLPFLLCLPVFGIFLFVSVFLYFLQSLNLTLVFLILKSFLLFLFPAFVFFPPFIHTVSKLYLL